MRKLFKNLSLLIITLITLLLLPKSFARAAEYIDSGDWRYFVNEDTTVTISRYLGASKDVLTIPETIDSKTVSIIGKSAFYTSSGSFQFNKIVIPANVTKIENSAFDDCKTKEFSVAADSTAFCTASGVLFSKDKTILYRFTGLKEDTSYTIPSYVTEVQANAFRGCRNLTQISIPSSVTKIGGSAFSGCVNLAGITIPGSVKVIPASIFSGCVNLGTVVFSEGVEETIDFTFYNCNKLQSITIPSTLTKLGGTTFNWCSFKSITVSPSNPLYSSEDGVFFNKDKTILLMYPNLKETEEYTIPDSVTEIKSSAFRSTRSLKKINFPSGIKSIGGFAFYDCPSLTEAVIPDGVTELESYTFYGCYSLEKVTLPKKLTEVGACAFSGCNKLASLVIPDTVTSIGENALDIHIKSYVSVGSKASFNPTITSAFTFTYKADDTAFATVNSAGKVTGKKAGTTKIYRYLGDVLVGTYTINVEFADVTNKKKYFYEPVYWAIEKGITKGYTDSDGLARTFKPDADCTREELITFIWRAEGCPAPSSMKSPFTDVTKKENGSYPYYYKAVLWAKEAGITKGYSSGKKKGTFGVGDTITREDCVTFLYRTAGSPDMEEYIETYKYYIGIDPYERNAFTDVSSSKYYYNPVRWAFCYNIANGYKQTDGTYTFGVGINCFRKDVVTFLYRM